MKLESQIMGTLMAWARRRLVVAMGLAMALAASQSALAREKSPFTGFSGRWAGSGYVALANGSKERIRCRATYASSADETALQINISCASPSYKVQVASELAATVGGEVSGTWRELTRQVSGAVSGHVSAPGRLDASLGGTPYGIRLLFDTAGRRQAVSMSLQNTDISSVNVDLQRT